jgi:hypothetical protein
MTPEALERHRVLELSREVDGAIDQLWAAGKVSVVLRLVLEDCERLLESLRASEIPDARELDELCRQGSVLGTPQLERDLTPAHRELLARLASGRRRSIARLRDPGARKRRLQRLALVVGLSLLAAAAFALFRNVSTARASGTYSSDYPAKQAIDGLSKTEWLLPHQQTGWLEVTFARARDVKAVSLRNATNGHYRDRAAKGVTVEVYAQAKLVASRKFEFLPIDANQGPVTLKLEARDVTHVRIAVESFYGGGGGIAEVDVK